MMLVLKAFALAGGRGEGGVEGRGRWGRERGAEGEGLRAAGEVYMGWRGARGEGRGVGYGRLGAKAGRGCLAGTGARVE